MCMLQPGWYGMLLSDVNVAIQTRWQHVTSRQAILDGISQSVYREQVFARGINSMRIFRIQHMPVSTVVNTLLVLALVSEHTQHEPGALLFLDAVLQNITGRNRLRARTRTGVLPKPFVREGRGPRCSCQILGYMAAIACD
jgi:hypothetical protein